MEGDTNIKVVKYERTPIMSTYLIAFVVGEYDYVEAKDADGVLVRVYTPVGKKEQGQFALEVRSLSKCTYFIMLNYKRGHISHRLKLKAKLVMGLRINAFIFQIGCCEDSTILQRILQNRLSFAEN